MLKSHFKSKIKMFFEFVVFKILYLFVFLF